MPGSTSLATISDDQWVQACIVVTDIPPCLSDLAAHCLARLAVDDGWDDLMVDVKPTFHRIAALRKFCDDPGFGAKARTLLTCTSHLRTESPSYSKCISESMPNLWKAVVYLATASSRMPPKEIIPGRRTAARIGCCAEKRRHACLMGEIERVCGWEAAVIFEEVHVASTDVLGCDAYMDSCEGPVTPFSDSWAKDL